jgi:hypothetical protein
MDIPICLLNSTDRTTHEPQKVDIQAVNSQRVVSEASEEMESHGAIKTFAARPTGTRIQNPLPFPAAGKGLDNVKRNWRAFMSH